MTGMLASVNSLNEALLVLKAQVDIIDLKQPANGALGALPIDIVKTIVSEIHGRLPISATIGDLPMHPEQVFSAVKTMATTGVDMIKIGFFPNGDTQSTVAKLSQLSGQNRTLIAVLFADGEPDFTLIPELKAAGFKGVMLDTVDKKRGSLTTIMPKSSLSQFVILAKKSDLLCGLAGSLKIEDIAKLLPYEPDYLGFRGALCEQHNRVGQLNVNAINQIKQIITSVGEQKINFPT